MTVSSIVNKVSEFGINIDPKSVSKTLDILIGKDIIAKIMSQTVIYEFKIDLIRIWLEQTKHLDQVLENYKSRM